jgi:hypothetical protein
MKQLLSFLLAGVIFTTTSCSKDDDNNGGNSVAVATSLKSGTWRITSYSDNGVDETADFSAFTFTFGTSGTVSATNSILTATGTWSTGVDDSKDELDLEFTAPPLFVELSEDWEIVSQTSTQISLRHISGGSGGTDLLVFQKN